jgi:group I intron endonuclease
MIGIYKWTSPSNRIYVGQSKNLVKREGWYLSNGIRNASMPKLKNSFNKYGIDKHIFEIIEYCTIEQLNEREIYWGLHYDTLELGLNCKLGEQNSIFSESTKKKMSLAKQGFKLSPSSEAKRQASLRKTWDEKNRIREEIKRNKPKYIHTEEHKNNLSKSKKGKPIHTESSKALLSKYAQNRDMTKVVKKGIKVFQFDKNNNFIREWDNAACAELHYAGKRGDNVRSNVRGRQATAYGYIWKDIKSLEK